MQFLVAQCAFEVRFIKMKLLYENFNFSLKNFSCPFGARYFKNHHQMPPWAELRPQWIYLTYILSY